ncbi:MAG TPA: serine protease, partial [Solirubrobacteraceae bacterium]|nr:serine protease [Solirubrobacteraceae bacterium]
MVQELQEIIATVAREVGPAVVGLGGRRGGGSGVVVAQGSVLTVAHALRDQEAAEVVFADGRRAPGRAAGVDAQLGIAMVAVDTGDVAPIAWSPEDSATTLGSAVLALADPGGRGLRATVGFVSSVQGSLRGPRGRRIAGAIEHSAPLPRGSSGGPLVDPHGRLVGINAVRRDGGLIVALPADAALRERVERLSGGEGAQPRT